MLVLVSDLCFCHQTCLFVLITQKYIRIVMHYLQWLCLSILIELLV